MKVFISSVRRGLEAERDALPGLIKAVGHEPTTFEDYTAQPVPSRQACLDGVEAADTYILLLGERYGDPLPDTGMAPTEEEFTVAKRRGIPILVFTKRGVTPEPAQADFMRRIEDYSSGAFRGSFIDPVSLNTAVASALRSLEKRPPALEWRALPAPVAVSWLPPAPPGTQGGTVLETHLIQLSGIPRMPAIALDALPARLARAGREHGLFSHGEALDLATSEDGASATTRPGSRGQVSGISVSTNGQVSVWSELPRDMLGAIVDRTDLAARIGIHLSLGAELVSASAQVAPAVGLVGLSMATEGNAADIGRRTSAILNGFGRSYDAALVEPRDSVPGQSLGPAAKEIAAELAARLVLRFREINR